MLQPFQNTCLVRPQSTTLSDLSITDPYTPRPLAPNQFLTKNNVVLTETPADLQENIINFFEPYNIANTPLKYLLPELKYLLPELEVNFIEGKVSTHYIVQVIDMLCAKIAHSWVEAIIENTFDPYEVQWGKDLLCSDEFLYPFFIVSQATLALYEQKFTELEEILTLLEKKFKPRIWALELLLISAYAQGNDEHAKYILKTSLPEYPISEEYITRIRRLGLGYVNPTPPKHASLLNQYADELEWLLDYSAVKSPSIQASFKYIAEAVRRGSFTTAARHLAEYSLLKYAGPKNIPQGEEKKAIYLAFVRMEWYTTLLKMNRNKEFWGVIPQALEDIHAYASDPLVLTTSAATLFREHQKEKAKSFLKKIPPNFIAQFDEAQFLSLVLQPQINFTQVAQLVRKYPYNPLYEAYAPKKNESSDNSLTDYFLGIMISIFMMIMTALGIQYSYSSRPQKSGLKAFSFPIFRLLECSEQNIISHLGGTQSNRPTPTSTLSKCESMSRIQT